MELKDFVDQKLQLIKNLENDAERAHSEERVLWEIILRRAADGYDVKDAAKEALKTMEINFPRWFA